MNRNFSQKISTWTNGRTGRFIIMQAVHTLITIAVIATLFLGAARVGALSGLLTPAAAPASSLTTINYQGRLADASGTPINNTNPGLGMTFALYTQQVGGTAVWSETQANVPVANGLFSVRLGSINALSANLLSSDLWLGIQVGTDPEMTPREKLAAVPYAMQASVALTVPDGAIGSTQIAAGSVNTNNLANGAVTASKSSGFVITGGSNLRVQSGRTPPTGTNFVIDFPAAFSGAPIVITTADTCGGQQVTVANVSLTNFRVIVPNTTCLALINWIAIGPTN